MSTTSPPPRQADLDDPALRDADTAAVLSQLGSGTPLDPALVERVRARARRITDDIRRTHGTVGDDTFQALLDDEA